MASEMDNPHLPAPLGMGPPAQSCKASHGQPFECQHSEAAPEMREHDERKQGWLRNRRGRPLKGLTPQNTPTVSSKAHITV
jgi:hypothetical protein